MDPQKQQGYVCITDIVLVEIRNEVIKFAIATNDDQLSHAKWLNDGCM